MIQEMEENRRSNKPPYIMMAVLGVHVAALGLFMMMSGCQTRRAATVDVPPAPAPILPPQADIVTPIPVSPRPAIRPPVPASRIPDTGDSKVYTVQKGDSLSKIAARAGVSLNELSELNKITNPNSIRIGQRLLLPAYAREVPQQAPSAAAPSAAPSAPRPAAGPAVDSGQMHTVVAGDSLGKLAARYGTSVAALRELNGLKNDVIRIGQKLKIPSGTKPAATPAPAATAPAPVELPPPPPAPAVESAPVMIPVIDEPAPSVPEVSMGDGGEGDAPFPYTIKDGDTLESLAIKFGARKEVIMSLNGLAPDAPLRPGQRLLIPWQ
jgi:LysM repeat protein